MYLCEGCSGLVVSTPDCVTRGPRIEAALHIYCYYYYIVQIMPSELSVSALSVAPPATHQLTSAFRRPPGLTSPSPGRLAVSPHALSTDPNSAEHSPVLGGHPPSHSPGSHPSAVQAALGMPPASNGTLVRTPSTVAALPPITGYGAADYSRKVNNMFDIVEVPEDEVVYAACSGCYSNSNENKWPSFEHVGLTCCPVLSSFVTFSPFHSELKTCLFRKSYLPP